MDTEATAREILAANRYLVLGTAGADGVPWVSPVWFASEDGETFLWISKPGTRHSRNIAARPDVAIVVFDSSVHSDDAAALYLSAVAAELDGASATRPWPSTRGPPRRRGSGGSRPRTSAATGAGGCTARPRRSGRCWGRGTSGCRWGEPMRAAGGLRVATWRAARCAAGGARRRRTARYGRVGR